MSVLCSALKSNVSTTLEQQRQTLKGLELAKLGRLPRKNRGNFDIEVISTNPVPGGVEVLAKAWKDGKQVGFGDGTVEIERFLIFNPPLLVPDENGDILREWEDEKGTKYSRRLREDPQEALLQVLEHNLSVMNLHGPGNIESGKVGKTTSTFFPAAGANSPVDGVLLREAASETLATLRSSAGTTANVTQTAQRWWNLSASAVLDQFGGLYRGVVGFDTSAIPDSDTVSSATLSFNLQGTVGTGLGSTDTDIVAATPAASNTLATTDYLSAFTIDGATRLATGIAISSWNAVNSYTDFTLNASGVAYVSKTGNTFFGTRLKWDVDNSFTGTWSSTAETFVQVFTADQSGTTSDPKLVVEHGAAAAASFVPQLMTLGVG